MNEIFTLSAALQSAGYEVGDAPVGGQEALVGRRGDFRWRWWATYLRLFITVRASDRVTENDLHRFTIDSLDMAKSGFVHGLQTGVAVIPVLIGQQVDQAALERAEGLPLRQFAAFAWPVVVDLSQRRLAHCPPGRIVAGVAYESWILSQINLVASGLGFTDRRV